MTATANQLIDKALSTSSEDEAIACLRMARKRGYKNYTGKQQPIAENHDTLENKSLLQQVEFWKKMATDWKNLYASADSNTVFYKNLYTSADSNTNFYREKYNEFWKKYNEMVIKNDKQIMLSVCFGFSTIVSFITILHLLKAF